MAVTWTDSTASATRSQLLNTTQNVSTNSAREFRSLFSVLFIVFLVSESFRVFSGDEVNLEMAIVFGVRCTVLRSCGLCGHAVSVRLSVMFVHSIGTNKRIFTFFYHRVAKPFQFFRTIFCSCS